MIGKKTMIVIVDKLGYVVPASIVVALKRRFDTVRVRELGMTMDSARGFVRERVVGKIRYQHTLAVPERDRFNRHLDPDVPAHERQQFVADVLAARLVRQWLREGYLETVSRGRYKRALIKKTCKGAR